MILRRFAVQNDLIRRHSVTASQRHSDGIETAEKLIKTLKKLRSVCNSCNVHDVSTEVRPTRTSELKSGLLTSLPSFLIYFSLSEIRNDINDHFDLFFDDLRPF